MWIVRIEDLDKGKVRIYAEGMRPFRLYKKELAAWGIKEESDFPEQQWESLQREVLLPRVKKRAMHLLQKMDRTEAQLREKLLQSEYPAELTEAAVAYVKQYHYIDDLRYAENYIRYRCHDKSRRQLALELSRKGISKETVARALEEEYGEQEESIKILRLIEKKGYVREEADEKQKQRMYQFLMRKGFRSDEILRYL